MYCTVRASTERYSLEGSLHLHVDILLQYLQYRAKYRKLFVFVIRNEMLITVKCLMLINGTAVSFFDSRFSESAMQSHSYAVRVHSVLSTVYCNFNQ